MTVLPALVLAVAATAAPPPVTVFDSMNEAATVALATVYEISPYYEYSGVIMVRPDGKFVVGAPTTQFAGDHVMDDEDPAEHSLPIVAAYHTHPCLPYTHVPGSFSPQDLKWARLTQKVEFMGDLCTGDVHAYDPSKDKLTREQRFEPAPVRTVGHFPVSGAKLEHPEDVAFVDNSDD